MIKKCYKVWFSLLLLAPQLRVVHPVPADPDGGGDGDVLPRVDPLEAALGALRLRHPLRRLLLRRRRPVRANDVSGKKPF